MISGATAHPGHGEEAVDAPAAADDAVDWNNYEKILLSKNTGEPIDLAVLPDSRILHTARDGVVRLTDSATGRTTQIAELDVYANSEDGLQGISLDPNFEENNWVYMVYAPRVMEGTSPGGVEYPETTPQGSAPNSLPAGEDESYWDQWLGYNQLSRFTFDPEAGTLDLASEREIIKVDAQRGQCCHVGADLAWDAEGNLFLSTGDNTPASTPGANGYTPINNAPGMNPGFDSRRGAGNTNDLRGKILRIDPIEDLAADTEVGPGSTYTIPAGNLFDSAEQPDLVREEIYVMGLRNPFRIDYDLESGALVWGDYGPDAGSAQPDRGPMGYVEWQLTTEPMNGGWPYCHGPNAAYNEWDFATGTPGAQFFDCEAGPENNSTWNTGLDQVPPVTAPQVYYGDNPGDQPELLDPLVELGGGGQAPMGGPIYRYDEALESDIKFPEYWDGHPLMAEFSQDYVAAFTLDELSSDGVVTQVEDFLPNGHLETVNQPIWDNVMDMEFGPDGALYVLEYGDGFFRQNADAGLYKITYGSDNATPRAFISAEPVSSSTAPLEVTFDASATTDAETPNEGLTFDWDFDSDGEYDAQGMTVTHTFTELGQYNVQLRVTDPEGNFGLAIRQITVGNTAPVITLDQPDGAIFDWGDAVPYTVSVEDAEDGNEPTCRDIQYTFGLGHNTHAHPEVSGRAADTEAGCGFTIQTSADAVEHGEGEKIFGTLVVTYTDQAQGDVPAITGEATHVLKPEVQQAEWYDAAEGVEVVDDPSAAAGSYVTSLDEGDSFSYFPIALHHAPTGDAITDITVRGRGEGTLSLGWTSEGAEGAAATEPLADFEFTGADWQDVTQTLSTVPEGSGSIVVTSTGGVDVDQLTFAVGEGPVEPVTVPVDQVSIQMFSLIPWVNEVGLPAVLERLSEIGFKNIEPFGGNFAGYTAEEFRALVDSYGLSVKSSHYNVDEGTFDDTLDFVTTVGQEYVGSGGFPAPGIGTYENTLATAEAMNRLGQRTVDAGLEKFFGHNHDGEFRTTYEHEGETLSAWEILVRETDPALVTFQLDVAWAAHAGVDVPALIEEYGDRIELLHIKDATGLNAGGSPTFTNLGDGDVPLQEILAAAQEAGVVYYVMEYDLAADGEDFATTGFEYLTGLPAGEPGPDVTVTAQARCLAGGAYVAVRALNEDTVPLTITLDTAYGSRTVADVAPGTNAYQAFNARSGEVDAGTATVTVTDAEGGTTTVTSEYAALACG